MRLMSMVAGAAEGSSTMQTLTEAMKGSFETMVSDSMSMIAMLVPIVLPLVLVLLWLMELRHLRELQQRLNNCRINNQ